MLKLYLISSVGLNTPIPAFTTGELSATRDPSVHQVTDVVLGGQFFSDVFCTPLKKVANSVFGSVSLVCTYVTAGGAFGRRIGVGGVGRVTKAAVIASWVLIKTSQEFCTWHWLVCRGKPMSVGTNVVRCAFVMRRQQVLVVCALIVH